MNTVGKIFICLIAVVCVMFMSFTLMLFASQINWKSEHEKITKQLAEVTAERDRQLALRTRLEEELQAEIQRQTDRVTELDTKVVQMAEERDDFKKKYDELDENRLRAIDAVKQAHASLASSRAELGQLRKEQRDLQKQWGELSTQFVKKTDEAHDLSLKLANFRSVGEKLMKDYRDAVDVLKKFNLKPIPSIYTGEPPKGVEGIVTEVRPGWIEISIGEDSGIMKGQKLDVYREANGRSIYICKVEVDRTEPDKAACRVLPEFRKGTVQRDDTVGSIDLTN
ncbi:MAG TPA: hypothetical protein DEB39_08540 [Planctomycetaceae bacterium]|nr:hypothetical protein [Planctomycetaceae bacterium]